MKLHEKQKADIEGAYGISIYVSPFQEALGLKKRPKTIRLSYLQCAAMEHAQNNTLRLKLMDTKTKGPHRPDAIRQRDANFQFSKTNTTVNG
jgi:hypothetical protein